MAQVTISQLLGIQQTVKSRKNELVQLRNQNGASETTHWGANADKPVTKEPVYDAIALDSLIDKLYQEERKINDALKNANATITVPGYEWNDQVLGTLTPVTAVKAKANTTAAGKKGSRKSK